MPSRLAGTRSCAIRHRTSEESEHFVKLMGKSLSSDSAGARSQKQQKKKRRDVQRRTGSASLPAPTERLDPIISKSFPRLSQDRPPALGGKQYFSYSQGSITSSGVQR